MELALKLRTFDRNVLNIIQRQNNVTEFIELCRLFIGSSNGSGFDAKVNDFYNELMRLDSSAINVDFFTWLIAHAADYDAIDIEGCRELNKAILELALKLRTFDRNVLNIIQRQNNVLNLLSYAGFLLDLVMGQNLMRGLTIFTMS